VRGASLSSCCECDAECQSLRKGESCLIQVPSGWGLGGLGAGGTGSECAEGVSASAAAMVLGSFGGEAGGASTSLRSRSALRAAVFARFVGSLGVLSYSSASVGSSIATVLEAAKRSVGVDIEIDTGRRGFRRAACRGDTLRGRGFAVVGDAVVEDAVVGDAMGSVGPAAVDCGECWGECAGDCVQRMAATIRASGGRSGAHSYWEEPLSRDTDLWRWRSIHGAP
jgi:hypothetical protein